jgi:hypothetical protein
MFDIPQYIRADNYFLASDISHFRGTNQSFTLSPCDHTIKMNGSNGTPNPTSGFLSFNSHPPRVIVTAEDDEFDEVTIRHWKEEGFDVTYIPMGNGGKLYAQQIKAISSKLSECCPSIATATNRRRTRRTLCHRRIRRSGRSDPRYCHEANGTLLRTRVLLPGDDPAPKPKIPEPTQLGRPPRRDSRPCRRIPDIQLSQRRSRLCRA